MTFLLVLGFICVVAAVLAAQPFLRRRRRRLLRERPFSAQWERILASRMPLYGRLPERLRERLRQRIKVFVVEKSFVGCGGLEIDDNVRLTIAAQACLLALNREGAPFPELRDILVYPGPFVVDRLRAEPSGVLQESRSVLAGESWSRGQVVLSWQDVVEGAALDGDGRNVVIHEFAHQLDQEKGHANGAPYLGSRPRYERWSRVLAREFAALQARAALGETSLLSDYGASDPAEFFAVASEVFFEQPRPMAGALPELYAELRDFYRVDPAAW